jgi:hypothetical protein
MIMRKFAVFACCVIAAGCARMRIVPLSPTEHAALTAELDSSKLASADLNEWGQKIHDSVEAAIGRAAKDVGQAKDKMTLTGAINTGVGAIGASLSGAVKQNQAKTVGVAAGIITALIGIYQTVQGGKVDATSCVQTFMQLDGDWMLADRSTDESTKVAFGTYIHGVTEARKQCLGIVNVLLPPAPAKAANLHLM